MESFTSTRNQSRNQAPYSLEATAAFATAMTLMILFTIVGNVLVIIAVLTSRALRAPQNLFLVSLATADILVATLVIPFSLANELMGYWCFSSVWCEIYLALDVLFCTSSILHLCAISLDRYLSLSRPLQYRAVRTSRRIKRAISIVWFVSAIISFPPLITMNKNQENSGSSVKRQCELSEEGWYILYSTIASFFAPCLIMIFVYIRIYQIAKRRTKFPPGEPRKEIPSVDTNCSSGTMTLPISNPNVPTPPQRQSPSISLIPEKPKQAMMTNSGEKSSSDSDTEHTPVTVQKCKALINTPNFAQHMSTVVRDNRLTFVLAVVIGVFVVCWFPFFFSYSLQAVCPETCTLPKPVFTFFFWMGYCNSCLNPVIYTIFNKDFRRAFKRILNQNTNSASFDQASKE